LSIEWALIGVLSCWTSVFQRHDDVHRRKLGEARTILRNNGQVASISTSVWPNKVPGFFFLLPLPLWFQSPVRGKKSGYLLCACGKSKCDKILQMLIHWCLVGLGFRSTTTALQLENTCHVATSIWHQVSWSWQRAIIIIRRSSGQRRDERCASQAHASLCLSTPRSAEAPPAPPP